MRRLAAIRSEDIVRAEIALLQRHRGIPRCEELAASPAEAGQTRSADAVVHWRKVPGQARLQRLVVGPDLNVGYEEIDIDCPAARP
jgi:hypothetical protein